MQVKLISLKIEKFGPSLVNWETLRALKKSVFAKDKYWHFFWEGDYTIVRCPSRRGPEVVRWFKNRGITCACEGWYIDNIAITHKYQTEFAPMFHAFSELALKIEAKDLVHVLERVNHCFLNMACAVFEEERKDNLLWESKNIAEVALWRAVGVGR